MEIRHLLSFEKVSHYKSFSEAARITFISQPAITAHINELERELGVTLFDRNTKPIELTGAGVILLKHTKHILMLTQQAVEDVKKYSQGLTGNISICASESTTDWLIPYLNHYKIRFPCVEINLSIYLSNITLEKVINRDAHIGIIKQSEPSFHHPVLMGVRVAKDYGIMVFSPHHRFALFDIIPKSVLSSENASVPIVIFGKHTDFSRQVENILVRENIKFDGSVDINHSKTVNLFLEKSRRVAFMPQALVRSDLDKGTLVTRPIQDFPPIVRFAILIYRKDAIHSKIISQFTNDLLATMGNDKFICR